MRREIITFQKLEGEGFHEMWERFKMLIQKCSLHDLLELLQLHIFYNGLDAHAGSGLDGAKGGVLMNRMYNDTYNLIENMAKNSCQWSTE